MTNYNIYIDSEEYPFINTIPTWVKLDVDLTSIIGSKSMDETLDVNTFVVPFSAKKDSYLPNTKILIVEQWTENGVSKQNEYPRYLTGDIVTQVGFGDNALYRHDITVEEPTVILKTLVTDSISVTQPLGEVDTGELPPVDISEDTQETRSIDIGTLVLPMQVRFSCSFNSGITGIKNKIPKDTVLNLASCAIRSYGQYSITAGRVWDDYNPNTAIWVRVYHNSQLLHEYIGTAADDYTFALTGQYDIYYYSTATDSDGHKVYQASVPESKKNYLSDWVAHYSTFVYIQGNPNPKGDYFTLGEVAQKLIDNTGEPLRGGAKSRYFISSAIMEKLNAIVAPEEYFTQKYLYENLVQLGRHIHAIPRLIDFYEITFDDLTATEESETLYPYSAYSATRNAEEHTPCLLCNAENIVANINLSQSTVIEGWKHFASDEARVTADNAYIEVQYPIYKPKKLYLRYGGYDMDVTASLLDSFTYSTMSRTNGDTTNSIAYKIYYEYNTRKIVGLTQKLDAQLSIVEAFKNSSIVNILYNAILAAGGTPTVATIKEDWPYNCQYKIEYMPIVNLRTEQYRTDILKYKRPDTKLIYNQDEQIVDGTALGNNLAATVAKIGNEQITQTFLFDSLSQLPKIGTIDKTLNAYICKMDIEFANNQIKTTIIYSKDWNKLSEYIGVDSQYRFAQVSETQALNRKITMSDYIVFTNESVPASYTLKYNECYILYGCKQFADIFRQPSQRTAKKVEAAYTKFKDKDGQNCLLSNSFMDIAVTSSSCVLLPLQTNAEGKTLQFTWGMSDNYSAGKAWYIKDGIYYNVDIPYGDYLGRAKYCEFILDKYPVTNALPLPLCDTLPSPLGALVVSSGDAVINKDNREALELNYQVNAIFDDRNAPLLNDGEIVIGNGFFSRSPVVVAPENCGTIKAYFIDKKLGKFYNFNAADVVATATITVEDNETTTPAVQYKSTDVTFTKAVITRPDVQSLAVVCIEEYNVTLQNGGIMAQTSFIAGKNTIFDETRIALTGRSLNQICTPIV